VVTCEIKLLKIILKLFHCFISHVTTAETEIKLPRLLKESWNYFKTCFSDIEPVGKYLWAAMTHWNKFRNNFILHVTMGLGTAYLLCQFIDVTVTRTSRCNNEVNYHYFSPGGGSFNCLGMYTCEMRRAVDRAFHWAAITSCTYIVVCDCA